MVTTLLYRVKQIQLAIGVISFRVIIEFPIHIDRKHVIICHHINTTHIKMIHHLLHQNTKCDTLDLSVFVTLQLYTIPEVQKLVK